MVKRSLITVRITIYKRQAEETIQDATEEET